MAGFPLWCTITRVVGVLDIAVLLIAAHTHWISPATYPKKLMRSTYTAPPSITTFITGWPHSTLGMKCTGVSRS